MSTVRVLLFVLIVLAVIPACGTEGDEDEESAAPFTLNVTPGEVADSAPGQRVVLLVTVQDTGEGRGASEAVDLTVVASGADVIVEPAGGLPPGVVGEVTIIPREELVQGHDVNPARVAFQPEPVATIDVEITAEREGLMETETVPVGIVPADGFPLDAAEEARDVFIPWLAEHYPELGITEETEWIPTPTKPHWLVVSHYLFFSDRWEMGVRWHIMIEPYNWAEIYLRERFAEVQPSLGFKTDSITEDPPVIYEVEVVEPIWR